MSKQRASREYRNWSLVIDEQGIRRLYNELQSIVSSPGGDSDIRFHVQYSDKSAVENWSIEDLLADENRSFRRIKTIEVDAKNSEYEISLKLGTKKKIKDEEQFVSKVLLDVRAPDRQRVFVVQSVIEDRLKSFRASRPAGWVILLSALVFLFLFVFAANFVLAPYLPKYLTELNNATGAIQVNSWFVAVVLLIGVMATFGAIWLFPDLEFLLGRGIERHQRRERIKTNLFWVVFVGILLSLAVSYFASQLS